MKLATYMKAGPRIGVVHDGRLWDLRGVTMSWLFAMERNVRARSIAEALVPDDMALFVRMHHGNLEPFRDAIAWACEDPESARVFTDDIDQIAMPLEKAKLLPPVVQPSKVICVGNSYRQYLIDQKLPPDEWPKDVKISFRSEERRVGKECR